MLGGPGADGQGKLKEVVAHHELFRLSNCEHALWKLEERERLLQQSLLQINHS